MAKDLRKENAEIALTILTMKLAIQYHALSHSIVTILRGSVLQLDNSHGGTIQPDPTSPTWTSAEVSGCNQIPISSTTLDE